VQSERASILERQALQRAVEDAEREIAAGEYVSNEEVMAEIDRWAAEDGAP
jgi:predicted transcriptional regulator